MKLSENERIKRALDIKTPEAELVELSFDESWRVKEAATSNTRLPIYRLVELSKDPNKYVKLAVAFNVSTPLEIKKEFAKPEVEPFIKIRLAKGDEVELLKSLYKDKDPKIRNLVAANLATPIWILDILEGDIDENIRRTVRWNKSKR